MRLTVARSRRPNPSPCAVRRAPRKNPSAWAASISNNLWTPLYRLFRRRPPCPEAERERLLLRQWQNRMLQTRLALLPLDFLARRSLRGLETVSRIQPTPPPDRKNAGSMSGGESHRDAPPPAPSPKSWCRRTCRRCRRWLRERATRLFRRLTARCLAALIRLLRRRCRG